MASDSKKKFILDNFRGLSDFPLADERTYARKIHGLWDGIGGKLDRMGGKISATSGPHGSIWTLAPLRFRGNWGVMVQDGSNRLWYDHNTTSGIYDEPLKPGDAISDPYLPHERYEPPISPRRQHPQPQIQYPSQCHSWWHCQRGEYWYPVTDLKLCQRRRTGNYSVSGNEISVKAAVDKLWEDHPIGTTGAWLPWNTTTAPLNTPALPTDAYFVGPLVAVDAKWFAVSSKYGARFSLRIMQNRVCSNTLGNPPTPPTGGEYDEAYYSGGGGIAGGRMSGDVGRDCVKCNYPPPATQACDKLCTTAFELTIPIPSRADIPDGDELVPKDGAFHFLYFQEIVWDGTLSKLWLIASGMVCKTGTSHFE